MIVGNSVIEAELGEVRLRGQSGRAADVRRISAPSAGIAVVVAREL